MEIRKTDKSIHNISVASIKRSTFKPYNYQWTKFYHSNSEFPYKNLQLDLTDNELIICSTVIDAQNYSILTTQKLITMNNAEKEVGILMDAIDKGYGDFKGYKDDSITYGIVELKTGKEIKYLIETGKASMIMIHGVRTLIKIQSMTIQNIQNVTRSLNKQNEEK